jgi:hypothetical protein
MDKYLSLGNIKEINKPLLYSLASSGNGEIYDVGIALHS